MSASSFASAMINQSAQGGRKRSQRPRRSGYTANSGKPPTEQDGLYFGSPCMTVPPSLQPDAHLKLPAFVLRPRRSRSVQLPGWRAVALLWLMLVPAARAALDVDVEIHGVSDELLANVRAFLTVGQQRKDPTLTDERGYFKNNITTHKLIINPAARTAAVELGMDTGPRYKFGAVRYHQDVLRPAFLS